MSERSVRRGTRRFEEEGEDGLRAGVSGVARAGRGRRTRPTRSGGSIGSATRASPPSISTSKHFHEQAFPRAPGAGPWLPLGLSVDQDLLAEPRLSGPGAAARTVASGRAGR